MGQIWGEESFPRRLLRIEDDIRRLRAGIGVPAFEWRSLVPYLCPGWVDISDEPAPPAGTGGGVGARYAVWEDMIFLGGTVLHTLGPGEWTGTEQLDPVNDAVYLINAGRNSRGVLEGSKPNLPADLSNDNHVTVLTHGSAYYGDPFWYLGYTMALDIGWTGSSSNGPFITVGEMQGFGSGYGASGRPVDPKGRVHKGVPHGCSLVLDGLSWRFGSNPTID